MMERYRMMRAVEARAARLRPGVLRLSRFAMHLLTVLLAFLVAGGSPRNAIADGIPAYVDHRGWHLLGEEAQDAVIAWSDGRENLLLRITLDTRLGDVHAKKLVWLTPIPAAPQDTTIDVLRGFPQFSGVSPSGVVASTVLGVLAVAAGTQIWPLPFLMTLSVGAARIEPHESGVEVHRKLVRDGIQVELLSASSVDALRAHLLAQDVALPDAAMQSLSRYASEGHCFALARIADFDAYRNAASSPTGDRTVLGVNVQFPSAQGFFPLVVSSVLPGESVDVTVTTTGFMRPVGPTPNGLKISHYAGSYRAPPEVLDALGLPPSGPAEPYTRFTWFGRPADLREDLHFEPGAPPTTRALAGWLAYRHHEAVEVLLTFAACVILAMTAALFARRAWPADTRPRRAWAALFGLATAMTVVGLYVAALSYASRKGARGMIVFKYVAAASLIFCAELTLLSIAIRALESWLR